MWYIISLAISVISAVLFRNMIRNLLTEKKCLNKNYLGEHIPVGMGLMFIPVLVLGSIPLYKVVGNETLLQVYIVGAVVMGLAGFIDDILGDSSVRGLKGHLMRLARGELTTGGLKAIMGFLMAIFISLNISVSAIDFILNTFIITLSTNLLNLLDLRPGRSIKGFLAIIAFLIAINYSRDMIIILPLICAVLVYMRDDLKANSMLGDTGSNILGISTGLFVAGFGSWVVKLCWFVFLIFIHIYTERYSLSRLIEENRVLKFLDELGR
ncbi:MAG: UDP-N-acetylmuramyl pentapeptide phosphotransferase [Thermoanaerobacteraceae bacterium]|nr:UDP-N-acetylmuramyl pentapeptide phosphotransferase [Thermoanaerobacteraceae bacterium]